MAARARVAPRVAAGLPLPCRGARRILRSACLPARLRPEGGPGAPPGSGSLAPRFLPRRRRPFPAHRRRRTSFPRPRHRARPRRRPSPPRRRWPARSLRCRGAARRPPGHRGRPRRCRPPRRARRTRSRRGRRRRRTNGANPRSRPPRPFRRSRRAAEVLVAARGPLWFPARRWYSSPRGGRQRAVGAQSELGCDR